MSKSKLSIILNIFFLLLFTYLIWESSSFTKLAMYFPLVLSVIGLLFTVLNLFLELRKLYKPKNKESNNDNHDEPLDSYNQLMRSESLKIAFMNFLWVGYFFILILLFGFLIATVIFLVSFLKIKTDFNFMKIIISIIITISVLLILSDFMNLEWPNGYLISFQI